MPESIHLPKLNRLRPTLQSTLYKIMEEAGELARAVLHIEQAGRESVALRGFLDEVTGELLDVAQTCVTMIFVLEDTYGLSAEAYIAGHLDKLEKKGYCFKREHYFVTDNANFKCMYLPRLAIQVTLLRTVCKIQEEVGELTQVLGKHAGQSGEEGAWDEQRLAEESLFELLDIAQCCFTMMYTLEEHYAIDMSELVKQHIEKLRAKGYWG